MSDLLEELASLAHEQWSGWMEYLFDNSEEADDGSVTIPTSLVTRWKRQMMTPYHRLPEDEKRSDRAEAEKVLHVIRLHALHSSNLPLSSDDKDSPD